MSEPNPISLLSVEPIHAGNDFQRLELKIGGGTPGSTLHVDTFASSSDLYITSTMLPVGDDGETTFILQFDSVNPAVLDFMYMLTFIADDGDGNILTRTNPLRVTVPVVAAP